MHETCLIIIHDNFSDLIESIFTFFKRSSPGDEPDEESTPIFPAAKPAARIAKPISPAPEWPPELCSTPITEPTAATQDNEPIVAAPKVRRDTELTPSMFTWQQDIEPTTSAPKVRQDTDPLVSTPRVRRDDEPIVSTPKVQGDTEPIASTPKVHRDTDPFASLPKSKFRLCTDPPAPPLFRRNTKPISYTPKPLDAKSEARLIARNWQPDIEPTPDTVKCTPKLCKCPYIEPVASTSSWRPPPCRAFNDGEIYDERQPRRRDITLTELIRSAIIRNMFSGYVRKYYDVKNRSFFLNFMRDFGHFYAHFVFVNHSKYIRCKNHLA